MRIAVYQTTDEVPDHLRCVAQFVVGGKFAPVYVNGRTADEARKSAQAFWDKHSEDVKRGRVPKGSAPKRAAEPVRTAESFYDPLDDI